MLQERPVWAEVSLENINHNYREVRRLVGPAVQVMAIVKANAYGHGAVEVAKSLDEAGADRFGVAIMNEAVQLRENGIKKPILILGWTPKEDYKRALLKGVTLTIFSLEEARELSRISEEMAQKAVVHLKIDTGMGRIGFRPNKVSSMDIEQILALPGLEVEGIFTHLARADEKDKAFTREQLIVFEQFVKEIEYKTGFKFSIKHAANSAAILDHPEAYLDMVRPGIMLYGLKPSGEVALHKVSLKQALSLRARVSFVKEVPPGTPISYGGRFITKADSLIATLPLGYADGYSRLLSSQAEVLYCGQSAPVVGRICMDQCMFDATGLEPRVKQGDMVTLIGDDGEKFISVDDLAQKLGTINYEIACMISARVPRIYHK